MESNADVKPRSTPLVVNRQTSAVDITAVGPPGLGKAARAKSDGSLLVQEKQGLSDTSENGNAIEELDGVGQVVGKFNFYMHKMAKNLESQNRQLLSKAQANNAAVEDLTKERDGLIHEKKALETRCEKLLAKNVAANAEAERLEKELKVLRMEREQRKHSDKRKMKEFQHIRERLSKRNSESSPSPSDSYHSEASPTQPLLDEFMPEPLHGGGMRRRVLSFASGLDLKPSSEIQRLSLENEQYRHKLHRLEQKIQYLREELKQQNSQSEPPVTANENYEPPQKGSSLPGNTQTEILKGCLDESLEENVTLRKENAKLKQELEEAMATRLAGSSPKRVLEEVAEEQGDVKEDKDRDDGADKDGDDGADTDTAVEPEAPTPVAQEMTNPGVTGSNEVDDTASNPDLIKAASRSNNETVDHIFDLLSKCVAVRSSLYLNGLDEIDSASPDEMGTAFQPCADAVTTGTDDVLPHGSQLCVDDSRSVNHDGPFIGNEDCGAPVKATPHGDVIQHDAWLTKDLTTVNDA